jgi:hypothetical protein
MTTCTGFLPTEASTLEALWDQEDEWWQYLYLLSDRFIEDGDEDGGRFLQWLYGCKQRPSKKYNSLNRWYWWSTSDDSLTLSWVKGGVKVHDPCLLPTVFHPVCNYAVKGEPYFNNPSYYKPVEAIEAAMDCWKGFTEKQKVELEGTWKL